LQQKRFAKTTTPVHCWTPCPPLRGAFGASPPPPAFQTGVHRRPKSDLRQKAAFNIAMRLTKYFIFGFSIEAQTFEGL